MDIEHISNVIDTSFGRFLYLLIFFCDNTVIEPRTDALEIFRR